jgi:hypothetical protein
VTKSCIHTGGKYANGACKECLSERHRTDPAFKERKRVTSRKSMRKLAGLPEATRPEPARCELCGGLPGKKVLAIDHDHVTGRFRGWLCVACNVGLGALGDSLEGLALARRYLLAAELT